MDREMGENNLCRFQCPLLDSLWWRLYAAHWEFFFVKLLSLSMRDDLSRGDGHLHRQSESEVCDGVHLCINVIAENIRHENLDNN